MEAELTSVDVKDHKVAVAVRRFIATCPKCGPFIHDRLGHHGSLSNKEMDTLFPKAHRRKVKRALPPNELIPFNRTLAGKRMAKDGEIERWLATQEEVSQSGRTRSSASEPGGADHAPR